MFLGGTPNRRGCEIENPFVLDFTSGNGVFNASASEPLVVVNRSLGYKLTYLLTHFSAQDGEFRYRGESYFEELTPKNQKEARRWNKRRTQSYKGSFQHFLRSAASGEAYEHGFRLYLLDELIWHKPDRLFMDYVKELEAEVPVDSVMNEGNFDYERILRFPGYLHIRFLDATMLPEYYEDVLTNYNASEPIRSAIDVLHKQASFNEVGFLNNAYDISQYGYWRWGSGVCNLLPLDFGNLSREQIPPQDP